MAILTMAILTMVTLTAAIQAPQTLLDGVSDIADAASFLRGAHVGGEALPLVLVGLNLLG